MKRGILLISFIFIMIILVGCAQIGSDSNDIQSKLKETLNFRALSGKIIGGSCSADADCDFGNVCIESVCKVGCLQDSDCSGGTCDLDTGRCAAKGQCKTDVDCKDGKKIRCDISTSNCVECYEQEHCGGDATCDLSTNTCKETNTTEQQPPAVEKKVNKCIDSDNGKDYFVAGKLSGTDIYGNVIDQLDHCAGDGTGVNEYYCTETGFTYETYQCPKGCKDGICVKEAAENKTVKEISTEEIFVLKAGEAKVFNDFSFKLNKVDAGSPYHEISYALIIPVGFSPSGNMALGNIDYIFVDGLKKYVLINAIDRTSDSITFKVKLCSIFEDTTCFNDACPGYTYGGKNYKNGRLSKWPGTVRKLCNYDIEGGDNTIPKVPCEDSDNGTSEFVKGFAKGEHATASPYIVGGAPNVKEYKSITGPISTHNDYCITETKLSEASCDEKGKLKSSEIICQKGCKDGACIKEEKKVNKCIDSDNGKDYFVAGKLSGTDIYGNVIDQLDHCAGDGTGVNEYYCTETGFTYETYQCPKGCKDGICVKEIKAEGINISKCNDPDAEDLSKATTVTYFDQNGVQSDFKDSCVGIVGVIEGLCNKDGTFACLNKDNCKRRCPKGKICSDGACIETIAKCVDSDSKNKNMPGSVTYTDLATNTQKVIQDKCIGTRFVEEGLCNSINQGRIEIMKCADNEVCNNGACIPSPEKCQDSDGNDRSKKGTVNFVTKIGLKGVFYDYCNAPSYLTEGLCKGNTFLPRGVSCPVNTGCKDGACVSGVNMIQSTCTESDNGFNVYLKGVTTFTNQSGLNKVEDYCIDARTLQEYYCNQNQMSYLSRTCYEGACLNGICKSMPLQQPNNPSSSSSTFRSSWGWGR